MGKFSDKCCDCCGDDNYDKNNYCDRYDVDDVVETLRKNIGRVVIIFTDSCCKGLSGLVSKVDKKTVKLITTLPSAPTYPSSSIKRCSNSSLCDFGCPSFFGSATVIPICAITSVVTAEV